MNLLKSIAGRILRGLGNIISFILSVLISITEIIVTFTISIGRGIIGLLAAGGCLLILMFFGPFGLILLLNPPIMFTILMLVLIPLLGKKLISYLKYIKYIVTEYLFDRADYLIDGKKKGYRSFYYYGDKYKKMEEEKREKERQRRQEEQQRQWEERFRQWNQQQRQYYQQGNSGYQQRYTDPTTDFKNKYEKSCDLLGLGYDTDKYEVKLAYRKKAKEFHPDLNNSPDATQIFQQINDAYEFLSDSNIDRYNSIK